MKKAHILLLCLMAAGAIAQAQNIRRSIRFTPIGKDSINMAYTNDYYLTDDSCAAIVRYGHFNFKRHNYFGKFKDVSKQTPSLVLAEGSYTADGHKDGAFISRYPNGNLHAKGNYKDNAYDGHWEINYDDGRPQITFDANNGIVKIIDMWDTKGKKVITNGNGYYKSDSKLPQWSGKLVNGLPDGKWKAVNANNPEQPVLLTEQFIKGEFQGGTGPLGDYTNASRIQFFNAETALEYEKAEKMAVSFNGCNPAGSGSPTFNNAVNAKYRNGAEAFNDEIKRVVVNYLSKINLSAYDRNLTFKGIIDKKGTIKDLKYDGPVSDDISRHLAFDLGRLPLLEPATVNNKPVAQNFNITFTFEQGYYKFYYQFLSVIKE